MLWSKNYAMEHKHQISFSFRRGQIVAYLNDDVKFAEQSRNRYYVRRSNDRGGRGETLEGFRF